ncbi:MAG: acyl--CoA ligase [Gammaproteobacteria bacterium]|nr:acyl--CoA ligase [Gammaproteobacteria bacterium]
MNTLYTLLDHGAADAPALTAPGRLPLPYAGLRALCERTVASLNRLGVGRGDRVGIVLPNGPEMAAAFLAVACGAVTAPLNPAYRRSELEFYLSDIRAKCLIIERGTASPARDAAGTLGIPLLELEPDSAGPAGEFVLDGPGCGNPGARGFAGAEDVALILHTSGTTSRPKIVPLSHANLGASARHVAASLALTVDDRCLNVMPLFHIHGLVAALLASLGAGGSTCCTPGFNALKFFTWLSEARPTWYTAVPTMHQAVLQRAGRSRSVIDAHPLRFIRSCSAALPVPVLHELEATFNAPVIEAYAMTEAAHQMTSNPLPPGRRRPGSVGIAAGPEVAVMDGSGRFLAPGETGEIVVRGANVTAGYENNPKANEENWTDGWFRTGDQGVMDEDDYIRITGRLKEIINRGGEKVSPKEIDDVLIEHPGIVQVVTFAIPHPGLGEAIGAAVVLAAGGDLDEAGLRAFAGERLARFKVPERIVFVTEIPKGPTGKLQRIGLAEKLGLAS